MNTRTTDEEDPAGALMDRIRQRILDLEDGVRLAPNEASAAALECELGAARDALWDARQREFDRDATGQDEEAFYSRFGSGDEIKYNDGGEPIGYC